MPACAASPRTAFEKMELQTTGMEFASEMVIKATLKKFRISEVPITLHKDGRSRPPHLKPWRDGWRHLRFMLIFSPRWLFLVPGLLLSALGIVFSAALAVQEIQIGGIQFNVGTLMVACMAVIVGFQLVAFAFFTKVFAIAEGLAAGRSETDARVQNFHAGKRHRRGLLVLLAGLLLFCARVWLWQQAHFGAAAVHRGQFAPADSGGHAHRAGHPSRFLQFFHERAGPENREAPAAGDQLNPRRPHV